MKQELKKIIIVSDGTGKTAKRLMDAVLAQYATKEVDFALQRIYQEVRTKSQLDTILGDIDTDYLVLYSLISSSMSDHFHERLEERNILHLNVLGPMLSTMSKFLGVHPDYEPGLLQIIDDRYYRRVDAIGYTVEHDDGQGHLIEQADILLLGVSRTCKTPISMYLACNFGMKVANIPIVPEDAAIEQLRHRISLVPRHIIFGLAMKPEVLMLVREERRVYLETINHLARDLDDYTDLRAIRDEVRFSRMFFQELDIDVIDVTRRAIEEISKEIVDKRTRVV
jgi:hypothetical protein